MIELIPFAQILEFINDRFSKLVNKLKSRNEKKAARLIRDMTIVVAAITLIDNRFRRIILDLEIFSKNWEMAKREKVIENIVSFASDETLIRSIRRSLQSIVEQQTEKLFTFIDSKIESFLNTCNNFLEDVGDIGERSAQRVTPFPSRENLITLVDIILNGKSENDVKIIKSNTTSYHETINKSLILNLETDYIQIKNDLMKEYPLIQDYGNAVDLSFFAKKQDD